jgi:hypothetical protein
MKMFSILISLFFVMAAQAGASEIYTWKVNSCAPLKGNFYAGRNVDYSEYATITIDFRNEKDCTLKNTFKNSSLADAQEYSYKQLPPPAWHFGCENKMKESSPQFGLFISLNDTSQHYGSREVKIEFDSTKNLWIMKYKNANKSRWYENTWDYSQECQLTPL